MADDPSDMAGKRRSPASAAALQAVLDYAPIGIWLQNAAGRLLFVNRTYCAAVGISEERFLAVPHYAELYDQATARSCMASDRAALAQEGPHTSWERVRFTDGQIHEIEIVKARLTGADGHLEGLVGLSMDVTERRRAERLLRESESRLAGIVDSAMDAIITVDGDGRILLFNAAAEAVFGHPATTVLGQPIERLIPERHRETHRGHLSAFAASGRTSRTMGRLARIRAVRANGEEFPCEASISRVDVEGRRLLTVILRDITELERSEAARRELEAQQRQAQKLEALGALAGGIAHDFNNLLGVILANAELALPSSASLPEVAESLDAIHRAGERARELVRRILAFARKEPHRRRAADLRPTLEEAVRFLRAALPAGVELRTAFAADAPAVISDPTEIHQIAVNLCTNAWHALDGGPGRIEVRLERAEAAPGRIASDPALGPGPYALLTVCDTGHGMDEATRLHIFEPFFTTKEPGRGTGLGLSMVRGIVQQMGGAIEVESQPGEGTCFRILLPAAEAGGEALVPTVAAPASALGRGERILYVDDEEGVARVGARILERSGFRVDCFAEPERALRAVQAGEVSPDLLVADVNMPGMSGLDLARELRRLSPGLPVVLTSGNVTQGVESNAARIGVAHLLQKPYSTQELREAVAALLRAPVPRQA